MSNSSVCELAWVGDVSCQDVYFGYSLRFDVQVFNRFTINLNHGSVTFLVGSSGAKKVLLCSSWHAYIRQHIVK